MVPPMNVLSERGQSLFEANVAQLERHRMVGDCSIENDIEVGLCRKKADSVVDVQIANVE